MKKILLCVVFGFLMIGCATKSDEKVVSKQIDDKQNTAFSKVFEQCVRKHTSDDCDDCLFVEYSCLAKTLYNDCTQNKDKVSCEEIVKVLPSVKECGKEECSDIGVIYGYAKNHQQAANYYEKACKEFNSAQGCANLGNSYWEGKGVKQSFVKAVKFYQKSCDLNFGASCSYLSDSYRDGKGVKQDIFMAAKYAKKACDLDSAHACYNLGAFYVNGLGVKQNLSTAKKFCGKSCDLGDQMGCDCYKALNEKGVK